MPTKYLSEKGKHGFTDGVAYATGKGAYIPFVAKKPGNVKTSAARSNAAKSMLRGKEKY